MGWVSGYGSKTQQERHTFVVCRGESCAKSGAEELLTELEHQCGGQLRHDLRIGASQRCIGHCAAAPAVVQDGRVLGWVSLRRLKFELGRLGLL